MSQESLDKYRKQLATYERRFADYQEELTNTYAAGKRGKLLRKRCTDIATEISILRKYIYQLHPEDD